jgi:hypothetical protein
MGVKWIRFPPPPPQENLKMIKTSIDRDIDTVMRRIQATLDREPCEVVVYRVAQITVKSGPRLYTAKYVCQVEGMEVVWKRDRGYGEYTHGHKVWPRSVDEFVFWSWRIGFTPEEAWRLHIKHKEDVALRYKDNQDRSAASLRRSINRMKKSGISL